MIRLIEEVTAHGGAPDLTLPEVALLLIAPFMHEQVYASAIRAFAPALPKEIDVLAGSLEPMAADRRRRLEIAFRSYPQPIRRVRRLKTAAAKHEPVRRGRRLKAVTRQHMENARNAADADVIMLWLLHRQLAKFAAMWHPAPDGTLDLRSDSLEVENLDNDRQYVRAAAADLSIDRILKLAKCVRGEPERLTRRDVPHPMEPAVRLSVDGELICERLLGALLCLTGWMALDVRAANDAVVDHVGIADPLDPKNLSQRPPLQCGPRSGAFSNFGSNVRIRPSTSRCGISFPEQTAY